ncbi:MAG: hypothetical protein HQK87_00095 [Nitrospinae bacterium]|nr:hypothetical protein [Nitrospinota bacterium]
MANANLDAARYLGEGWRLFKENGVNFAVATLVVLLISVVASLIPFASFIVSGPLLAGLSLMALDAVRGGKPEIGRLAGVTEYLVPTALIGIVTGVFGAIGTLLLVIPGILVFGWYMFSYLIAIDTGAAFWPAMERSRSFGFQNQVGVFVFALILTLVNFLGALMLGLGLLVTIPVSILAVAVAYQEHLAGANASRISETVGRTTPPPVA